MKKPFALSITLILILLLSAPATYAETLILENAPTQVYFSPNGGCTEAIVKEITNAKSEILVQAYSFTSTPIAKALVDAHKLSKADPGI
jgi:phosphatidylserine/phosphatidylglycerophosphate/cardiolipin synthase-like enzyme